MLNSPYRVRHIYPHGPAIESCDEYWNNIKYDKEELKIMLYDMPLSEGHFNKRCLNSDELLERIEDLKESGEPSSSDFFIFYFFCCVGVEMRNSNDNTPV